MDTIALLVRMVLSVAAGLIAGFSTIYVFNRVPAKWLCDYDQEPDKEMWGERISKNPWNGVFALVFIGASVKLMDQSPLYQIAGLLSIWLLLQIGIADKKYMIIPDQFIAALAVAALGFIPFQDSFMSPLYGVMIGGGCFLLIGITGRLILKKDALGFGDVKLMAAVGLLSGLKGIITVVLFTVFSSAIVLGIGMLAGHVKRGQEQPLGPFIAACTAVYIIFRGEINLLTDIYLSIY